MTDDVLRFFGGDSRRIALFEAVEAAVLAAGESELAVAKTQISWGNPKKFAFLSLPRRVARDFPQDCVILTFGLEHQAVHPRIAQSVEPYPNRWTHHVPLTGPEDVDEQVQAWLDEAYAFAKHKRPRHRR